MPMSDTFRVKAWGLPEFKAWVSSKEPGNPLLARRGATTCDVLDLLSQCPFAERYTLVTELVEPFDNDTFLYDAKTLLELMSLACTLMQSFDPVSQCEIGNFKFECNLLNGEAVARKKSVLRMMKDASILKKLLGPLLWSFAFGIRFLFWPELSAPPPHSLAVDLKIAQLSALKFCSWNVTVSQKTTNCSMITVKLLPVHRKYILLIWGKKWEGSVHSSYLNVKNM